MMAKHTKPVFLFFIAVILTASLFTTAAAQPAPAAASGFSSQFNGSMNGWATMGAVKMDVNSKYLYATGLEGYWSQAYYKNATFSNFTYTVLMKRLYDQKQPNCLFVRMGTSLIKKTNKWYPGYAFCYRNYGNVGVFKRTFAGDVPLQNWKLSDAVIKMGWNTLKVVANGTTMKFFINDTLISTVKDGTRSRGYVGVGMYDDGVHGDQLRVDWAKLSTLPLSP